MSGSLTFRSGDLEADTLIVRDNDWGSPEEDAQRRDFTINGLFYDSATETIIDYVEGYPDIQKRSSAPLDNLLSGFDKILSGCSDC